MASEIGGKMKRFLICNLVIVLFTSCTVLTETPETGQGESSSNSVNETNPENSQIETLPDSNEITPEFRVDMKLSTIKYPVYKYSWSQDSNILYYTGYEELGEWSTYPEGNFTVDFSDIFPVLTDEVTEKIGYYDRSSPPKYSISPSGRKVVFWEQAFTKPTATPAEGIVSNPEEEWLFDVYVFSAEGHVEKFITRFDGWILDAFWSNEENQVFLKFDQFQISSENILVRIDTVSGAFEEVIPSGIADISPWIAMSPDDNMMLYQVKGQTGQVILLDLKSGEETKYSGLPEFTAIYWLDNSNWLLVSNTPEGSLFIIYDYTLEQEQYRKEFSHRIMSITGFSKPTLSPSRELFAFEGDFNKDFGTLDLHILAIHFQQE